MYTIGILLEMENIIFGKLMIMALPGHKRFKNVGS